MRAIRPVLVLIKIIAKQLNLSSLWPNAFSRSQDIFSLKIYINILPWPDLLAVWSFVKKSHIQRKQIGWSHLRRAEKYAVAQTWVYQHISGHQFKQEVFSCDARVCVQCGTLLNKYIVKTLFLIRKYLISTSTQNQPKWTLFPFIFITWYSENLVSILT